MTESTITMPKIPSASRVRFRIAPALATYFDRVQSKPRLKMPKNPLCASFRGLRTSAHSAGLSVKATNPEIVTAVAIVIANCL